MRDVELDLFLLDPNDPRRRSRVAANAHPPGEAFAIRSESQDPALGAHLEARIESIGETLREASITWVTREVIAALGRARGLRRVRLGYGHGLTDDDLAPLAALAELHELRLDSAPDLKGGVVRHFAGSPLRALSLRGAKRLSARQLAGIEALPSLASLHLADAARLADDVFARLAKMPALARLWLISCGKLTAAGIPALTAAPALRTVNFWGCRAITRDAVEALAVSRGLAFARAGEDARVVRPSSAGTAVLDEPGAFTIDPRADDATLRDAATEVDLDRLTLEHAPGITDAGLAALLGLSAPRGLTLSGLQGVSATGVAGVVEAHRETLQTAALGPALPLHDSVLCALGGAAGLRFLQVDGMDDVTDAGVAALGRCQALEVLDLRRGPRLSPAGLSSLAPLPALFRLTLRDLPALDDEALSRIAAGAPALTELQIEGAPRLCLGAGALGGERSSVMRLTLKRCDALTAGWLRGSHPNLAELRWVSCAGVNDAWIDALTACPRLDALWLWDCPAVTTDALVRLIEGSALRVLWLGAAPAVHLDAVEAAVSDARRARGRCNLERLREAPA